MTIDSFMRRKEIIKITGLSSSTIWRLEKRNDFPKRRFLSSNIVGWVRSEIMEWMNTRKIIPE